MQQTYNCPNCSAPISYGERFCGYCGFTLTWQPPQPPPYGYQQPWGPQQQPQWGQQNPWGQQPGGRQPWPPQGQQWGQPPQNQWGQPQWNQPPGYNQQPQWANQNPYDTRYAGYYGEPEKRSSSGTTILIIFVILLFIAGGVILATNGSIFDSLSGGGNEPTGAQGESLAPQSPAVPAVTYNAEPKIVEFFADPASIKPGDTANLLWQVSDAGYVMINNGIGKQPPTGQLPIKPADSTSYTITVTNNVGTVAATTVVTVSAADIPQISFKTTSTSLNVGKTTDLQWTVSDATSIYIDQDIGDVTSTPTGSKTISPVTTTTYTLTASNATGTNTASVTINVSTSPDAPVITSFSATPDTIAAGQPSTLEWYVTGAKSITITPDIGAVSSYGSKAIAPGTTTSYILTASNDSGSVTATLAIVVEGSSGVNSPIINTFSANPTEMTLDSPVPVTLTWDVTNADTVTIFNVGAVAASGTTVVYPITTTIYTITATNSSTSINEQVTVTVYE